MSTIEFEILPQPDDTTCGPTCLHAVYRYLGDTISLDDVIRESPRIEHGGTLSAWLGCHALRRGYRATIYTYNLSVFDPSWFPEEPAHPTLAEEQSQRERLIRCLEWQLRAKDRVRIRQTSDAFVQFLRLGGTVRMQDLTSALIRRYLNRGVPVLTGLSSTFLYKCPRELPDGKSDDVRGLPTGHFVVLCGYDKGAHTVRVADPYHKNPLGDNTLTYRVSMERLVSSILLGVLTHDGDLFVIEAKHRRRPVDTRDTPDAPDAP